MVRSVVFDLDGVLVDSEPLHFAATREMCAAVGLDYSEEMNREFIGQTAVDHFGILVERHGLPGTLDDYLATYEKTVVRILSAPLEAAEGAAWLLGELRRRGCRLGLASSSRLAVVQATLRGLGFAGAFDVVVGGEMVERGKPAPDIYLLAAERLGTAPARCIAVEDSPRGMMAAVAAGMVGIGLMTTHVDPGDLAGAHRLIGSLRAFPMELIDKSD